MQAAQDKQLKIAIILNGISLFKNIFYKKYLPVLQQHCEVDVFETLTKHDAILLSSKATETYSYRAIIAAGGDGTLHQVVNGVIKGREDLTFLPAIGVIPMGSGNDFAKTAGIRPDPQQLLMLLKKFSVRKVNIGRINYVNFEGSAVERFFINVADIGMGPDVVRRVNDSGRAFGASVAYYKSIITTFLKYKPVPVTAKSGGWKWSGKLRSLAVANGKYWTWAMRCS